VGARRTLSLTSYKVVAFAFLALCFWGGLSVAQAIQARKANHKRDARLEPPDWMCILILIASLSLTLVLFIDGFELIGGKVLEQSWAYWAKVFGEILKQISELCCFSLLVCVFAISVHGVRITASSGALGRLQYVMVFVNIVQSLVVVISWVLVVSITDTKTQVVIIDAMYWVISVPVILLSFGVFLYGGLLVRRINQSSLTAGSRKSQDMMQKTKHAAAMKVLYITCLVGVLFLIKAVVLILHASTDEQAMPAEYSVWLKVVGLSMTFTSYVAILYQHGDKLGWIKRALRAPMPVFTLRHQKSGDAYSKLKKAAQPAPGKRPPQLGQC